jgi:hypothetical protein
MARCALVLLLATAVVTGCASSPLKRLHVFPRCADGLPVEVLIDPACPPDGICGYSCLPGRWDLGKDVPC